ncbi:MULTISPECIES: hypothetical protein [Pseudomonas]|uniref:Uncharacterized protein n=1 Tax=Pseudomonas soli TaxID=1306993 RepID=A0A2V4I7N0_9PSED|nr:MULTISPECIES: hypothetical protein [Pseudomonas]MBC3438244.1 hypothetical protein [Pseudomonas sp. BW16M2]PYB85275.1 hypothetical protein DMX07_04585 [Pseudomonas soli]QWA29800.1 hypothetical protein KHO27_02605 [Pseudomonas sp. RC3H12]
MSFHYLAMRLRFSPRHPRIKVADSQSPGDRLCLAASATFACSLERPGVSRALIAHLLRLELL